MKFRRAWIVTALAAALHDEPLRGAEVLLKGSRGIGLERLVEYL